MKNKSIGILTQLTALGLLMAGQSFAATGGSFYASQLSSIGAGNTSYGNTNGSPTGYTVLDPLVNAIDLQVGDWSSSMAKVINATDQPSFMEWDLPSGTFNAQTVIAYRNNSIPFASGSPWHLELFDGSTWKPFGVGGAGGSSDATLAMGNSSIGNATKIRAIYDHLNFHTGSGLYFMSMGELVVLPDELHTVTNSYTASASSENNISLYNASFGIDNQLNTGHSWISAPGDSNAWYTLSFTSPATLNALLLSKWTDLGVSTYTNAIVDVYVNGTLGGGWTDGTKVAGNVDMVSADNIGSFNVFKFDSALSGVNNLSLKFISGGRTVDGAQGLEEIIPLTIPEPSAVMLLGLGGLLMIRRKIGSSRA